MTSWSVYMDVRFTRVSKMGCELCVEPQNADVMYDFTPQ